jgi:3'-phosphoadenosine 5'-phosphosulfate sulfotransferase
VFHSHISDNGRSHFADLVPGTLHTLSETSEAPSFLQWLRFLRELSETHTSTFSGKVAVELEAGNNVEWIYSSQRRLSSLLASL